MGEKEKEIKIKPKEKKIVIEIEKVNEEKIEIKENVQIESTESVQLNLDNLKDHDMSNGDVALNDNVSSCSSSDNGSFVSLGIGIDPFALNKRYFDMLNQQKVPNKTIKVAPKQNLNKMDERAMMLAHGMKPVQSTSLHPINGVIVKQSTQQNNAYHSHQHHQRRSHQQYNNQYLISPGVHINHSQNRYYGHNHHHHYFSNNQKPQRQQHQYDRYRVNSSSHKRAYHGHYRSNNEYREYEIYSNQSIPPRMRGSKENNKNNQSNKKAKNRQSNGYKYNKRGSKKRGKSLYHGHRDEYDEDMNRDRYRNRESHQNSKSNAYYQYGSNSKQYNNYSRKSRR